MARQPYIGTGRLVENDAEFAVRKQDFNSHAEGGGFRHSADMIDMNPPLPNSLSSSHVQGTLEKIQNYLQGLNYVTIGDGDTSTGDFTVGSVDTPTVYDCFIASFNLPHMSQGGVILMKPGIYVFNQTVTLPAGFSVLGHAGSTILSSGPGLVIGSNPMFKTSDVSKMNSKTWNTDGYAITDFSDLIFVDNYLDNDSGYLVEPNSSFIQMTYNSKVRIKNCNIIGKVKEGSVASNTTVTTQFVRLYDVVPKQGALLDIQNCIIYGVQKVITFYGSMSHLNVINFTNNRVWCMFKTDGTTVNYMVDFYVCNAKLNNNFFKFTSANTSVSENYGVCFRCLGNGSPPNPVDIIVNGNTLSKTSLNTISLSNQLIVSSSLYARFKTSDNIIGGVSESDWYIIVGDGLNSSGDINGTHALNVVSNLYSHSMTAYKVTGQANLADQTTIYIRPGTYTITSAFNQFGIGAKLIGLKENENLPRINVTTTPTPISGWVSDTSYIILGTHLENLFFSTNNSNYVRIVSPIYFGDISTQNVFGNSFIAKNCCFYNVGILPRQSSPDLAKPNNANVVFESCRFGSANSGNYLSWTTVYLMRCQVNYIFKNCVTEKILGAIRYSGKPIGFTDTASLNWRPNLTIENCNFSPAKIENNTSHWLMLQNMGDVTLKNSTFDISAETTNNTGNVLFISVGDNSKKIIVDNCIIKGNNIVPITSPYNNTGLIGLNVSANYPYSSCSPSSLEILNTHIRGVSIGIYSKCDSGFKSPNNFIIKNNKQVFSSKSSSFLVMIYYKPSFYTSPFNLIVSENTVLGIDSVPGQILGYEDSVTSAVINCICQESEKTSVVVEKNKIYDIKTSSVITDTQSAISIKGFHSTTVIDNTITMIRSGNVDGYVIDCQMVNSVSSPPVFSITNNSFFKANGNHITYTSGATYPTTKTVAPIYARNIHYVNIKDNAILLEDSYLNITNYIRVINTLPFYNPLMDGIIENNMFNKTLKYEQVWNMYTERTSLIERKEVLAHNEAHTQDSRICVKNNKNQKAKYDISCTNFKQYGFNTFSPSATLLLKDTDMIRSDSSVSNMNRTNMKIMYETTGSGGHRHQGAGSINFWDTLPSGLYYSNVWRTEDGYNSKDPMVEKTFSVITGLSQFHFQNQILIPLSSLPRDCEILNIDIPIYLQNLTDNQINVEMSGSFILGNSVTESSLEYSIYLDDLGMNHNTTNWGYVLRTLRGVTSFPSDSGILSLLTYNNFDTSGDLGDMQKTNTNSSWLEDEATRLISNPDLYVLLSINRIVDTGSGITENDDYLAFAIPYARVTIRY